MNERESFLRDFLQNEAKRVPLSRNFEFRTLYKRNTQTMSKIHRILSTKEKKRKKNNERSHFSQSNYEMGRRVTLEESRDFQSGGPVFPTDDQESGFDG